MLRPAEVSEATFLAHSFLLPAGEAQEAKPVCLGLVESSEPDSDAETESVADLLRAAEELVQSAERRRPPAKKRRKKTRPRKSKSPAPQPSDLIPRGHHERQCSICNHPERDAIEEEFLHWYAPSLTGNHFNVGWRALYRHAHATGLYAARERNLRSALGHIVEQACHITPTVDGVLRAIRAYSCLDRDGQWTEPPAHVVVSSGSRITEPPAAIAVAAATLELPAMSASHPELPDNENK